MSGNQISPGVKLIQKQVHEIDYETQFNNGSESVLNRRSAVGVAFVAGGLIVAISAHETSSPDTAMASTAPIPIYSGKCPNPLAGGGTYDFGITGEGSVFVPGSTDLALTARDTYAVPGRTDVKNNYICVGPDQKNVLTAEVDNNGTAINLGKITVAAGPPGTFDNKAGLHFKSIEPTYTGTIPDPNFTLANCKTGVLADGNTDDSTYSCDFSQAQHGSTLVNIVTTADRPAANQSITVEATPDIPDTNLANNLITNNFVVVGKGNSGNGTNAGSTTPNGSAVLSKTPISLISSSAIGGRGTNFCDNSVFEVYATRPVNNVILRSIYHASKNSPARVRVKRIKHLKDSGLQEGGAHASAYVNVRLCGKDAAPRVRFNITGKKMKKEVLDFRYSWSKFGWLGPIKTHPKR